MLVTVASAPLVSIISVTRNDVSGLEFTGESVSKQTFGDIEWIVADGDSHDGTKALMGSWDACPVTFLSKPDRSIYEGMNNGAAAATGTWLHFLNAGDAFSEPSTMERVAEILTQSSQEWGFGAVRNLRADGSGFSMQCASPFDPRGVALGNTTIPHQGTFVRRETFESLNGFLIDFGTEADQEFIYRLSLRGTPFEMVWPIADVRMGGTGWNGGTGHFPRAMRRARRAHGTPIGGNWIVDSVATGAVLGKSYWTKTEGFIANRLRG
jgi:glycosyltransferase involved in cell wall biosynthesis